MNIPVKKLNNGFAMPEFGIGTWMMGGGLQHDPNNDDEANIKAIRAAIDLGVKHIDTAELYGENQAEKILGQAIKGYDRKKLFLVSKAKPEHFSYDDLIVACKNSLKRLETDYLDLYLLHVYSPDIPLDRSIKAMDKLVKEGLIKNIGVSNFNTQHLKEAQQYSENKIVCNQVHYNLMFREPEKEGLLDYCQKNDVLLVAWRPVEKGVIVNSPSEILQKMADKYQKTPAQIAINWLIAQRSVVTLAKSTDIGHLKENLGAVGWYMEQADIEILRQDFPCQQYISDVVPLG